MTSKHIPNAQFMYMPAIRFSYSRKFAQYSRLSHLFNKKNAFASYLCCAVKCQKEAIMQANLQELKKPLR